MEGIRILVVDDEQHGVDLLRRGLRKLGEVDSALSAEEAWERFQEADYHLVISDQRMPGMSGVDLLQKVAEADATTGRILVTGYSDLESTIDAINCGRVHAYVAKPCDPVQLRLTVQGILERVALERENADLIETLSVKNTALEDAFKILQATQESALRSEKLAAIGSTVAMVVHDLRGPVTSLKAGAGHLSREGSGIDEAELLEVAEELSEEAARIEQMCTDLLESTSTGRNEIERELISIDEIVADVASCASEEAGRHGVEIEVDTETSDPIDADHSGIRRSLLNLVYNAVEAMPQGGLVRIRTRDEKQTLRISVMDTGPGIAPEIRDQLFEPFASAGKSRGSGLGLAIVAKVVDDHAGSIEFGESPDGGAAFHIVLPRGPSSGSPDA